MKVLVVSADPQVLEQMEVVAGSLRRRLGPGEPLQILEASDGVRAARLAWRERPEVVLADEITSRAGAFALTRELKGAEVPFSGRIVILLDRSQDEWLAQWAGADGWAVKPIDPFELADLAAAGGDAAADNEEAG
jgi:DNA-binding NarL/FixJ family response regulator